MNRIQFFSEDISFIPSKPNALKAWLVKIIDQAQYSLEELNYIFCSDSYLLKMNQEYLNHDTYTDIITFDNSEEEQTIEGDIFISIERIKDNAAKLMIPEQDELHRVMAHGVLHLLGYDDSTPEEKALMRKKEEACLSLRNI